MSKVKITAPVPGFTGIGVGGLQFKDGVAHTSDEGLINYCIGAGYGVQSHQAINEHPLSSSELAEFRILKALEDDSVSSYMAGLSDEDLLTEMASQNLTPSKVRALLTEPVDPRSLTAGGVVTGAPLRDAAVDPLATDFLAPTNAGEANPHGPLVVAPGIHGVESQVIRPGQVFVDDLAKQDAAETEQADKILVQRLDVGDAVDAFVQPNSDDPDAAEASDTGPLGLSDPGSIAALDTGNAADAEPSTDPDGTSTEPPAGNASLEAWQGYARSQGATEESLDGVKRDELRDRYTPAPQQ